MLASDQQGGVDSDAKFSLASEIIELVVLTNDHAFLETLRVALGEARRLWHVPSADKVGDLLLAGEVGIVVLDSQALDRAASLYVTEIKRQFPDLVILLAGDRSTETALSGLISAGTVYRYIHKPMSPGRARLFVEAAVKKYEEQRPRRPTATATAGVQSAAAPQGWMIGAAMAGAALVLAATVIIHGRTTPQSAAVPPSLGPSPALEATILARAAAALAANRLVEPPGDNALELYLRALARNPSEPSARAGIAEIHERLYARAQSALLEERFDLASAAIDTARKAGVESGRIALLTAELAKGRAQIKASRSKLKPAAPQPAQAGAAVEAAAASAADADT